MATKAQKDFFDVASILKIRISVPFWLGHPVTNLYDVTKITYNDTELKSNFITAYLKLTK